jgi:hypothetical protein
LIDLDQQASATKYVGIDPDGVDVHAYHSFTQNTPLGAAALKSDFGFDLVPSHELMAAVEAMLESGKDERLLGERVAAVTPDYDFVLIDTPPGKAMLTFNAIVAAEHIVVPVAAERMAVDGLADRWCNWKRWIIRGTRSPLPATSETTPPADRNCHHTERKAPLPSDPGGFSRALCVSKRPVADRGCTFLAGTSSRHDRQMQDVTDRPDVLGQSRRYGRGSLPVAAPQSWNSHPQRFMGTREVVIRSPPVNVQQQVFIRLGQRPGTAAEWGYALPDREIQALDERCLDGGSEA